MFETICYFAVDQVRLYKFLLYYCCCFSIAFEDLNLKFILHARLSVIKYSFLYFNNLN